MPAACFRFHCIVALAALSASCHASPTAPAPMTPATSVAPLTPVTPSISDPVAAALAMEQPSLVVSGPYAGDRFKYEPRFRLRETRGVSGASIRNVFVGFSDGGGDNTGPSCLGPLRILPMGTLDIFFSDHKELGYCAPFVDGTSRTPDVHVVVTFTDDAGRTGQVRAIFTVSHE